MIPHQPQQNQNQKLPMNCISPKTSIHCSSILCFNSFFFFFILFLFLQAIINHNFLSSGLLYNRWFYFYRSSTNITDERKRFFTVPIEIHLGKIWWFASAVWGFTRVVYGGHLGLLNGGCRRKFLDLLDLNGWTGLWWRASTHHGWLGLLTVMRSSSSVLLLFVFFFGGGGGGRRRRNGTVCINFIWNEAFMAKEVFLVAGQAHAF